MAQFDPVGAAKLKAPFAELFKKHWKEITKDPDAEPNPADIDAFTAQYIQYAYENSSSTAYDKYALKVSNKVAADDPDSDIPLNPRVRAQALNLAPTLYTRFKLTSPQAAPAADDASTGPATGAAGAPVVTATDPAESAAIAGGGSLATTASKPPIDPNFLRDQLAAAPAPTATQAPAPDPVARGGDTGEQANAHVLARAAQQNPGEQADAHIHDYARNNHAYALQHPDQADRHMYVYERNQYLNQPTDWSKVSHIFTPFKDADGNVIPNGENDAVNGTTNWLPINYHSMRLLSARWGGPERNPYVLKGIESFARQQGLSVEEFLAEDTFAPRDSEGNEILENGQPKKLSVQEGVFEQFKNHSGLMALTGEHGYHIPLLAVRFEKKSATQRARNEWAHNRSGEHSAQALYGSNIVFLDKKNNQYTETGQGVQMRMGVNDKGVVEKFDGAVAKTHARIYLEMRHEMPDENGKVPPLKYYVTTGKGALSEIRGKNSEHARIRDLMWLNMLNEARMDGRQVELGYTQTFAKFKMGKPIHVKKLDYDKLSPSAILEMEGRGIDVHALIAEYNMQQAVLAPQIGPSASGTPANINQGTPVPGAQPPVVPPALPVPTTARPLPPTPGQQTGVIPLAELAGAELPELAYKLSGNNMENPFQDRQEQRAEYTDIIKQIRAAARIQEICENPDAPDHGELPEDPTSSESVADGETTYNHLRAEIQTHGDITPDDKHLAQAQATQMIGDAQQRLQALGMTEAASKIGAAWLNRTTEPLDREPNNEAPMAVPGAPVVPPRAAPAAAAPTPRVNPQDRFPRMQ